MEMLIKLALIFSKLYTTSFAGGYVMLPVMQEELESKNWATATDLIDTTAIAAMSPGSVAANAAVGMGYKVAGFSGAAATFLGIIIPNILLLILVSIFFFKIYKHPKVKAAFYGLRPVVVGIIIYAAVSFALRSNIVAAHANNLIKSGINIFGGGTQLFELKSILIIVASFIILTTVKKAHPIFVIAGAGLIGMLTF